MKTGSRWIVYGISFLLLTAIMVSSLWALVPPDRSRGVGQKTYKHPDFDIPNAFEQPSQLPPQAAATLQRQLAGMGLSDGQGRLDRRGGRWATLLFSLPLIPGKGVGNTERWPTGPPRNDAAYQQAARIAFDGFLQAYAARLRINLNELARPGRMMVHRGGELVQFYIPRRVDGIPVRGSHLTATINNGNLVLFGLQNWGTINVSTQPEMSQDDALASLQAYLDTFTPNGSWGRAELNIVPMARGRNINQVAIGQGYTHRLVWVLKVTFPDDQGRWEALVDAESGEVLSFEDTNQYAEATGGVYPKTNDGMYPDGSEQPGWPMPFMDIGSTTTDTGGNYDLTGSQEATFFGPYVNMADQCGTDSLTQSGGLDWGTSGGTDCDTPGFGGAGNTHASRAGFYEINRIKEMARGQLPGNTWLQGRLTANMNIDNTCNAFWNGSTVNFYRSGGGCANTGEIAAVFDHEWGHGMDANDLVGGIASPSGEGIADIYSALRLNDSCIGRNFRSTVCTGFGDPCLTCTGVRDIDYEKRASGNPHTYTWSNANCGGQVHCVGSVYAEAVWSLWKRKLPTLYGMDNNTAAEIVTRLTYIGAGSTSTWFSGGPPNGGCSGSSGYMNYLAADDDDGNLNNGTPHMTAIYQAFNDQEIACNTPAVQDSGCTNVPAMAPNVTVTSADTSIVLSWGAVANADHYDVFRTEGIFQCDFGKVKIGSTGGTSFADTGLQNGRDYSYVVIPKGSSDACFGPASACATQQPGKIPCTVDADCDDGLFCNGAETCVAGFCAAGSDPCAANPTWTCDDDNDICVPECEVADDCNDYDFCNGEESCNAGTCAAGSDPCPGQSCDEGSNMCTDTNGPQIAVYDAGLGAPMCATRGSSCDSATLLDSRSNLLSPAEPNQPNTLNSCTDGTSGSYHSDESNDRIVVSTLDGQDFREGMTVEIAATVWAWATSSSDTLDLYYTADADNPIWTYLTSIVPPSGGAQTLTAQYTLPVGTLQAVRTVFRYSGSLGTCGVGAWDDTDDLVFAVGPGAPQCTVDADCDDGAFCNGAETCNAGICQAGTPPACDDGAFCNGAETCDEASDSCDPGTPVVCDDGLFCNGTETCNEDSDSCDPGTPVVCDDGRFCNGAEICNEASDSCDPGTPVVCDDGLFCNGTETCNEDSDSCDPGTPPNCSADEICEEAEGGYVCVPPPTCEPKGASCSADSDCCSNKCRGRSGSMSCK